MILSSLLFFTASLSKPNCFLFFLVTMSRYIYVTSPPIKAAKVEVTMAYFTGNLNVFTHK